MYNISIVAAACNIPTLQILGYAFLVQLVHKVTWRYFSIVRGHTSQLCPVQVKRTFSQTPPDGLAECTSNVKS